MKITKRQLQRIQRIIKEEAHNKDELITWIRQGAKDLYGRRDADGTAEELVQKSVEELEDILFDQSNSGEQQDINRNYRDKEEDRMGRDYDLSPAELAPTRQSMARRPAGSKAVRRMENVNKIKKIIREVLRND